MNKQKHVFDLYPQITCRNNPFYVFKGESYPDNYPSPEDKGLIREMFAGLNDVFADTEQRASVPFILGLKDYFDCIRIGVQSRTIDPVDDHIKDFITAGLGFLDRNQDAVARTIKRAEDNSNSDPYYSHMLENLWILDHSPDTDKKLQDYIFNTIDSWHRPKDENYKEHDEYHNEDMIVLALEAGQDVSQSQLYRSNKFLISKTGNSCEIKDLHDNKSEVFSRKYTFDHELREMNKRDIRRNRFRR